MEEMEEGKKDGEKKKTKGKKLSRSVDEEGEGGGC